MAPDLRRSGLEESLDVSYKPTSAVLPETGRLLVLVALARESIVLLKSRSLWPTLASASNVLVQLLLLAFPALEEFQTGYGILQRDVFEVEGAEEVFLVLLEGVRRQCLPDFDVCLDVGGAVLVLVEEVVVVGREVSVAGEEGGELRGDDFGDFRRQGGG